MVLFGRSNEYFLFHLIILIAKIAGTIIELVIIVIHLSLFYDLARVIFIKSDFSFYTLATIVDSHFILPLILLFK